MSTTSSATESQSQRAPIPAADADLETSWRFLEEGLGHIMSGDQISYMDYQELYTVAYNCMTVSRAPNQSQEDANALKSAMRFAFYEKLTSYLVQHVEGLRKDTEARNMSGVDLLQQYAIEWEKYKTSVNYLSRVFTYLNRHWVVLERQKGNKDVYPVDKLALVQWKEHFLRPIQGENLKLTSALLEMIEKQRSGETGDQELLKNVTDSFVALGIDDENLNKQSKDVYKEQFETPYVGATAKYIASTLEAALTGTGASGFLEEAQKVFVAEDDRALLYIRTFEPKEFIENCVNAILADEHIWTGFKKSVDDADDEELGRIHALVQSLPEVLEPVRQKIGELDKKTASETQDPEGA